VYFDKLEMIRQIVYVLGVALLVLILPLQVKAQRHYRPGYVILNEGDTLYGRVKDRKTGSFTRIYKRVRFKDKGLFARKFGPGRIREYKAGERLYESMWVSSQFPLLGGRMVSMAGKGKQQFFRVVVKGKLNYYALESLDDDEFYFDIPYLKLEGRRDFVRATQGIFGLKRRILVEYFADCPELQEAIAQKNVRTVFDIVHFYERHCQVGLYYNPDYQQ